MQRDRAIYVGPNHCLSLLGWWQLNRKGTTWFKIQSIDVDTTVVINSKRPAPWWGTPKYQSKDVLDQVSMCKKPTPCLSTKPSRRFTVSLSCIPFSSMPVNAPSKPPAEDATMRWSGLLGSKCVVGRSPLSIARDLMVIMMDTKATKVMGKRSGKEADEWRSQPMVSANKVPLIGIDILCGKVLFGYRPGSEKPHRIF